MTKTIEQQVADIILQRETEQLEIDGKVYKIGQPSVATLILVSEIISTLPIVERVEDRERMFYSVIHNAKDFGRLGDIVATLILGAKAIREDERRKRSWLNIFRSRKPAVRELGEKVLENVNSKQLFDLVVARFNGLDIGSFFAITTSLNEANILRPTKEVGHEATQYGQQS